MREYASALAAFLLAMLGIGAILDYRDTAATVGAGYIMSSTSKEGASFLRAGGGGAAPGTVGSARNSTVRRTLS